MSIADWIGLAAFLLSVVSLIWQWYTHVNDRKGNLDVNAEPDGEISFASTGATQKPDGGFIYTKAGRKLNISITNKGREVRFIKACILKVDHDQSYRIPELSDESIQTGQIIKHAFHPIDKLNEGRRLIVCVEDSLGKHYTSRNLKWEELE